MVLKLKKKNIFWIISYGVLIILGTQILATYLYKDINNKIEKFITDRIDNEKIIKIDNIHYSPGKGDFQQITLTNHKSYPLFIENRSENIVLITLNSIISKNSNSKYFKIKTSVSQYNFTISDANSEQKLMRILFLVICLVVILGTFINFGIERETLS